MATKKSSSKALSDIALAAEETQAYILACQAVLNDLTDRHEPSDEKYVFVGLEVLLQKMRDQNARVVDDLYGECCDYTTNRAPETA